MNHSVNVASSVMITIHGCTPNTGAIGMRMIARRRRLWSSGSIRRTTMLRPAIASTKSAGLTLDERPEHPRELGIDAERRHDRRQAEDDAVADEKIPVQPLKQLAMHAAGDRRGDEAREPDDSRADAESRPDVPADHDGDEDDRERDLLRRRRAEQRPLQVDAVVHHALRLPRPEHEPQDRQRAEADERPERRRGDEP